MIKPWMIVAGAFGLFGLILVTRHFRSADDAGPGALQARVETLGSTPRAQHGGWLASEDEHGARSANPSKKDQNAIGGPDALDLEGGSATGSGSARTRYAGDPGTRASGGSGFGSGHSDSLATAPDVNVPAAPVSGAGGGLPSHDMRKQTESQGSGPQELAKKSDQPSTTGAEDPNAPALSVSFDKTTQPETADTVPAIDQNVQCGGSGEGCTFNTDSKFAIPDAGNLSGDTGSISFCLQPQWGGGDMTNAGLMNLQTPNMWENHLKIFKNGEYFRFSIWPNSGVESGVSAKINNWQPGQWHPVTVTFGPDPTTGVNTASMYLDGTLIGQQPYDGPINIPQQQPLYIGSDLPGGEPTAGGSLMNFQAYNRILQPDEAANFAGNCPQ